MLKPDERDARKIHAARVASINGKPLVQRTVEPEATPATRARTVTEYLEQRGETREAAHDRVLQRFGPPGQARTIEETPRTLAGTVAK